MNGAMKGSDLSMKHTMKEPIQDLNLETVNVENGALRLKAAIRHLRERGLSYDICWIVNQFLRGTGYKLVKDDEK